MKFHMYSKYCFKKCNKSTKEDAYIVNSRIIYNAIIIVKRVTGNTLSKGDEALIIGLRFIDYLLNQ